MKRYPVIMRMVSIILIMACLVCALGCARNNYDSKLVDKGRKVIKTYDLAYGTTYEVSRVKDLEYTFKIGDNEYNVNFVKQDELQEVEYFGTELTDKKILKIFEKGKKIVIDYINQSDILKDKEELISAIKSVDIKYGAYKGVAEYHEGTVYINTRYENMICEWVIVHELVHFISELTHNGFENKVYPCTYFDETLTDLITMSMNPSKISEEGELVTGYVDYYDLVLMYVGSFGEKAIRAYFYGYDNIYEVVGEEEVYTFVRSLDAFYEQDICARIVWLTLSKWAAMNI